MKIDLYTKGILTVIALSLVVIAFNKTPVVKEVLAQSDDSANLSMIKFHVKQSADELKNISEFLGKLRVDKGQWGSALVVNVCSSYPNCININDRGLLEVENFAHSR